MVAKKSSVDDDDDLDLDLNLNLNGIGTYDDYDDIESEESLLDDIDARRRLERVLEDKALQRMIFGDFYDGDFDRDVDLYNYD